MNISDSAPKSDQSESKLGDAYLQLQLEAEIASVLLLENIQEVLVMPIEQITFMPSMPDCFLGLMNRRSHVLWVIDLPQMLCLEPLKRDVQQYHIAIARVDNRPLGLAVQQVRGVIRLTAEEIESPLNNSPLSLTPYLQGCVQQQEENILVLDTKAILNSPSLDNN